MRKTKKEKIEIFDLDLLESKYVIVISIVIFGFLFVLIFLMILQWFLKVELNNIIIFSCFLIFYLSVFLFLMLFFPKFDVKKIAKKIIMIRDSSGGVILFVIWLLALFLSRVHKLMNKIFSCGKS